VYDPTGESLAFGCRDGHIYITAANSVSIRFRYDTQNPNVSSLAYRPAGEQLAVGCLEGQFCIITPDSGEVCCLDEERARGVRLAYDPTLASLAIVGSHR
jgi:hypothetical protein